MSPTARSLIVEPADVESSTYDTIGVDTCMGDHKVSNNISELIVDK